MINTQTRYTIPKQEDKHIISPTSDMTTAQITGRQHDVAAVHRGGVQIDGQVGGSGGSGGKRVVVTVGDREYLKFGLKCD